MIAPLDCNQDGILDNLDHAHARPSSYHTEGFNVAYSDGHVEFFHVDNSDPYVYRLYRSKLTPAAGD